MSTKIYNGWLLDLKLSEVLPWIRKIRPKFELIRAKLIDQRWPDIVSGKPDASWASHNIVVKLAHAAKSSPYREPFGDYSAEIVLIPVGRKLLCLAYWQNKEYDAVWKKLPEVSSYGYWDNVDPEEGADDAEWRQRQEDWDAALPDEDPIPSHRGFTATILTHDIPRPDQLQKTIKSVRSRKKKKKATT